MTDPEVPDRSRTALYTWGQLAEAKPDEATVTIGNVEVTQPTEPETFTGEENITATIPDVVGVHEVCEMLGISRQALEELREPGSAGEDFPVPTELECGPVWDARWIRHHAARRANG